MKTILAILALALAAVAGTVIAAAEHPSVSAAAPDDSHQLPNKGRVLEVINTSVYTYIQVSSDKGLVWIATPKLQVATGDHISYSNGSMMTNFPSKSLNRTFESIIFVENASVLMK